ncbi:MAG: hypothetical protein HYU43_00535, partial [Armatimonadetes bacterium]|nr:hypothetical protein [Armatimonadota bacterium]
VIGFLDETRNVWAESGIASRYLRARLEWNALADVDAIVGDFYSQWYGPASKAMRAFYEALEDEIEKTPMHGHEDRILPEVYSTDLMAALSRHLAEAEKLAQTEAQALHVRADRLIFEHLKAYVAMSAAEAAGDFAEAAKHAQAMLDLRTPLHQINPFFIWPDEAGYHSGIWYWGVTARRDYYQSLADMTTGKTGDRVALLPDRASFRTDPHEDGIFARWFALNISQEGWRPIQVTRPYYCQGYEDAQGHPYIGTLWYRFNVDVPALAKDRKVMIYAPVVETEAWCWVNGEYVGHRPYQEAYIRPLQMEFDVTQAIRPGAANQVTIRVSTSLMEAQASDGLFSRVFLYAPK